MADPLSRKTSGVEHMTVDNPHWMKSPVSEKWKPYENYAKT